MKTKILRIGDKKLLTVTIEILRKGGLFVFPSETCYGIGCDATKTRSVEKIYSIKKRPKSKKMAFYFHNVRTAKQFIEIDHASEKIARKLMPGPLSIVTQNGYGFRIPNQPFLLRLLKEYRKPIAQTSANISGNKNIYKIKDAIKTFDGKVDMIIDGGDLPPQLASTVFDTASKKVLRRGSLTKKEIMEALK